MLERANIVGDLAPPPEASDKASLHFVHGRGLPRKLTQKLFAETLGAMNTGHSTHAWFEGEGTGDSHSIFFFFFLRRARLCPFLSSVEEDRPSFFKRLPDSLVGR